MKATIARGIALALAGCWFTAANAHAQFSLEGPYRPANAAYNPGVYGAGVETPSPAEPSLLNDGPEQQPPQQPPMPVPEKVQASPWQDYSTKGNAGYADGSCGTCDSCGLGGCGCCGCWFGGVYGLVMDRDDENNLWLSYDNEVNQTRLLSSRDADMDWSGGFEARLGRYFNCGNNALEVVYWGVFPETTEANAFAFNTGGELLSILHFDALTYDFGTGPQSVNSLYDNAQRHQLIRSHESRHPTFERIGT